VSRKSPSRSSERDLLTFWQRAILPDALADALALSEKGKVKSRRIVRDRNISTEHDTDVRLGDVDLRDPFNVV
jgi:hypothetical protein